MPTPKTWNNAESLISDLRNDWKVSGSNIEVNDQDWPTCIKGAVGRNTFRAFQKMPDKPSSVFREWAYDALVKQGRFERLKSIQTQQDYDRWLDQLVSDLRIRWKAKMNRDMPFGPSYKLPNLVMKVVCERLAVSDRQRIMPFLHVPLDSYTLSGIRKCVALPNGREIPKTATMKFIDNPATYASVQQQIRGLASRAGVPAIAYDHLAWDRGH